MNMSTPKKSSRQTRKTTGAQKVGTRSGSVPDRRVPLGNRFSPLESLREGASSDEEEEVDRPLKGKAMCMSKWDFLQRMTAANHPIIHDQEQLELTYRYIDLANSMLKKSSKRMEEIEDMQDAVDTEAEKRHSKESPPFFRGNMSTTVMVNGVDQIVRHRRARGWSQALTDLFWEARVMVRDFWVVKKQNDEVVSVLVQTSSRYQKILAIGAVNEARGMVREGLGRAQCRVNVRDAFPREQMEQVQNAYNRGFQLKKEGKIQAYRVYNQGRNEPVFEVRTEANGKVSWGPAPALGGAEPAGQGKQRRKTDETQQTEDRSREGEDGSQTGGERERLAVNEDSN
jgi:hypothetical protein